tara:strand:+ start:532 stop:636 length:105 start_codon:yes stop_codon:yes gene_type:complete
MKRIIKAFLDLFTDVEIEEEKKEKRANEILYDVL